MLSITELIDFLLGLLRDPGAQAAFEQDPQGTLAANGLAGVSAEDVRDARLLLADGGQVRDAGSGTAPRGDHDPVREINYTTQHYVAAPAADGAGGGEVGDRITNIVNIDDRDTFIVDSFNEDNDGVDNKGGEINESAVAGDDIEGSLNDSSQTDVDVVAIDAENSFNTDNSTDVVAIDADNSFNEETNVLAIDDSFNEDTDVLAIDAENSFNDTAGGTPEDTGADVATDPAVV
jgi:hypothetical protein